jgi:hypothetical protein
LRVLEVRMNAASLFGKLKLNKKKSLICYNLRKKNLFF